MSATAAGTPTGVHIRRLVDQELAVAARLFHRTGATSHSVSTARNTPTAQRVLGPAMPPAIWLGAFQQDLLLGALHADVPDEAEQVARDIVARNPHAAGPGWLLAYSQTCTLVNEIAVEPRVQRTGIASALFADLHRRLLHDPTRTAHFVTAYTTNPVATASFVNAGYSAEPQHTPVPAAVAMGLQTAWDITVFGPTYGSWVHRTI